MGARMPSVYDELFDALANEHRRRILFDLFDQHRRDESPVHIDAPPDADGGRKSAAIEQYHIHLPKLDDKRFIDWKRQTNTVRPGDRFADIRPVLAQLYDVQVGRSFEVVTSSEF